MIAVKTVARLSLYRRLLMQLAAQGAQHVYSHELAALAGSTATQVRRDLMAVGCTGSPSRGYHVGELMEGIGKVLDAPEGQRVGLVGVGNLGRAILAYFGGRRPKLSIVAAFDVDPYKINRVIHGCRCHPMADLARVVDEESIEIAILTVRRDVAQKAADQLVRAGVKGILNFAPVPLRAPAHVYVEDIDMAMSLEKVAFFARKGKGAGK